jgi:hypothetical protein
MNLPARVLRAGLPKHQTAYKQFSSLGSDRLIVYSRRRCERNCRYTMLTMRGPMSVTGRIPMQEIQKQLVSDDQK